MPSATAFFNYSLPAKVGRWWFQRRSYSLTPWIVAILVLTPEFHPTGRVLAIGLTWVVIAEAIRVWAVGYAGSATRTRGDSVPQLVCAGPYRWVRNPLYIANILLYTSIGVLFGFKWVAVGIFAFSAIQYVFIVWFEEEVLTQTFGDAYRNYCAAVPRWFPFRDPAASSNHEFSLWRGLKSEKSTFFSIIAIAALFFAKRYFL